MDEVLPDLFVSGLNSTKRSKLEEVDFVIGFRQSLVYRYTTVQKTFCTTVQKTFCTVLELLSYFEIMINFIMDQAFCFVGILYFSSSTKAQS